MTPPTDNLYKFIAISGIVVALFFGWTYFSYSNDNEKLKIAYTAEFNSLTEKLETANKSLSDALATGGDVNQHLGLAKIDCAIPENKTKCENAIAAVKIKISAAEAVLQSSKTNLKTTMLETSQFQQSLERQSAYVYMSLPGIALGIFMAIIGFKLWYYKVQYYQDIELRNKSDCELHLIADKSFVEILRRWPCILSLFIPVQYLFIGVWFGHWSPAEWGPPEYASILTGIIFVYGFHSLSYFQYKSVAGTSTPINDKSTS